MKFAQPNLVNFFSSFVSQILEFINPIYLYIILVTLVAICSSFAGISVGEDISGQVNSAVQFHEGKTNLPHFHLIPSNEDLATDIEKWGIRPPGASLLPIIGLKLGASLGQSIWIFLLTFALLGGIGWIRLSKSLFLSKESLIILTIFLGLNSGLAVHSFGTMNSVLHALLPWTMIWSLKISKNLLTKNTSPFSSLITCSLFYLVLGSFCILKLSGLIAAITVGFIPIISVFFSSMSCTEKTRCTTALISCSILTLLPYTLLENINEDLNGISSDEMYSNVDYNEQSLLWGKHFVESTRGAWLALSTLGGPGYALFPVEVSHGIRNFFLQFDHFANWLNQLKINPHTLLCGTIGFLFTAMILLVFWRNRDCFHNQRQISLLIFYILPFVGFSIVSYLHGFNYTLYSTHTIEYVPILMIPIFIIWQNGTKLKGLLNLICGLCIAIPITLDAEHFINRIKNFEKSKVERKIGFSSSRYSKAIEIAEGDSNNALDIIYFLPSGNKGDLELRTRMRTISTHFAGNNFPNTEPFLTSKMINIYCIFDTQLLEKEDFKNAFDLKFPKQRSKTTILDGEVSVVKVELLPN